MSDLWPFCHASVDSKVGEKFFKIQKYTPHNELRIHFIISRIILPNRRARKLKQKANYHQGSVQIVKVTETGFSTSKN